MAGTGHLRKRVTLTIDGATYECEVTNVTLTPNVTTQTTNVLCADGVLADVSDPAWSLDVDYLVDHNAGSFYRFLVGNHGAVAAFTYEPDPINAAGVTYAGSLRVLPGPAGGEAGSWESGSVSLPVIGQPAITDPAPEAANDQEL
jgi:hypothetical protein